MSRSGFSHSPIAGDTTRQKLDELEALIQQMLNLPVNRLDPDWPTALPAPAAEAEDRVSVGPEDRGLRMEDRGLRMENRGQHTEQVPAQRIEDTEATQEPQSEKIEEDEQVQPVIPSSILDPRSSILDPQSSAPRWWLYPIVGLNLLFDGLTFLLGPLGRWLRSETGRLVMGWAGVALLLAALVWTVLGWMGWLE
jgi:hypothetical protein